MMTRRQNGLRTALTGLALALMSAPGIAQEANGRDDSEPVELARSYTVHALPTGYDATSAYPVIYVMDGPGHLVHTVGSARFLASNNRMPEAIVVAIGNTPGNRTRDMTPAGREPDPSFATAGGASNFQAFIRNELKPWVESRYTTRAYDVLIGHSFGGLFIAHLLNTEPGLFDAYVAISPSLWWDDEHYVSTLDDVFERFPNHRGALYMTMGNEGGAMIAGAWHLAGTLEKSAPPEFRWHWQPMPTETHGSVPARSTYDGLEWIFSGWYPIDLMADLRRRGASELDRLEGHFAELSRELGWEVLPPEVDVVNTAFQLGQTGRSEDALAIAQRATEWFPDSAYSRTGVGAAHASACRWTEAEQHLVRALEMAERGAPGMADFVRSQIDEVRKSKADAETCDDHG